MICLKIKNLALSLSLDMNMKKLKSLLGVVAVFVAVIGGLFIIGEGWSVFDTKYYFFGKKRTAEMEEMYGIKVTDNIHLKEYKEDGFSYCIYDLTINRIDSYEDFLQNNVKSSDISEPVFDDHIEMVSYSYRWQNNEVYIDFFPQRDNTYMATLSIYE